MESSKHCTRTHQFRHVRPHSAIALKSIAEYSWNYRKPIDRKYQSKFR